MGIFFLRSFVIWSTLRSPAAQKPEYKHQQIRHLLHWLTCTPLAHLDFFSFFFFLKKDYAHLIWHDVTTCYANTTQKHWFHNLWCTAEIKRKQPTQTHCIKTKRHITETHDFNSLFWSLAESATCSQLMEDPDKCFVLIFTTISTAWSSVKCGWNLRPRLLWIIQHWV